MANPISFVIGALVALGAVVVYAWNKFEGFRAGVMGVWYVIKPFIDFVWNHVVKAFETWWNIMGKVWDGLKWVGNKLSELLAPVKELGEKVMSYLVKPFEMFGKVLDYLGITDAASKAGESIGQNFTAGWNAGIADFKDGTALEKAAVVNGPKGIPGAFANTPGGSAPPADPNAKSAKAMAEGITGGGQRNVTINIGEMGNGMTVNVANLKEAPEAVKEMMLKMFIQIVNSGNQVQLN